MTKPTTLRRHLWTLRAIAELCEQHGLPAPKVEIGYSGGKMGAEWYPALFMEGAYPTARGAEVFQRIMGFFPDLKWERNTDSDEYSYDRNYFRVTAMWDVEGGLPVELEVWATRQGFPVEEFLHLPVKVD
jgi:hypothetical protein